MKSNGKLKDSEIRRLRNAVRRLQRERKKLREFVRDMQWVQPTSNSSPSCAYCGFAERMTTAQSVGEFDPNLAAEIETATAICYANLQAHFPRGFMDQLTPEQISGVFKCGFADGVQWAMDKVEAQS